MRSYTIEEIDRLRRLLADRERVERFEEAWDGSLSISRRPAWPPEPDTLEELTRTAMIGGVDVDELEAEIEELQAVSHRFHAWRHAEREMDRRICGATTGHEFVPCPECVMQSSQYARGRAYSDRCSRHRWDTRQDTAACKDCGAPGRRRADRGRPGGRRSTDDPRTPEAGAEVVEAPAPRRRWWRFW